jgi:hypothetical protein
MVLGLSSQPHLPRAEDLCCHGNSQDQPSDASGVTAINSGEASRVYLGHLLMNLATRIGSLAASRSMPCRVVRCVATIVSTENLLSAGTIKHSYLVCVMNS